MPLTFGNCQMHDKSFTFDSRPARASVVSAYKRVLAAPVPMCVRALG